PEPAATFRDLTLALADRFPDCPPYDGQHEDVVPHLTIAHDVSRAELEQVEQEVRDNLPIRTTVSGVSLWSGSDEPDSWRRMTTFRLG
ncbi:MAG TPA: 2'-5' RNA ligase family protein, partial [Segeticoccus sp.]|uniref:2'-5' RNA ligase family protein n=1 Tax=Segeticoccus sp. TaxID=2706531 RepID=UPI002D7F6D67